MLYIVKNYTVSADDDLYHKARICAAERMKFPTRKDLDPWEVSTGRSYYEEQVLSPNKKHEGTGILISDKAPPHGSV